MFEGRFVATLPRAEASKERLGLLMAGQAGGQAGAEPAVTAAATALAHQPLRSERYSAPADAAIAGWR